MFFQRAFEGVNKWWIWLITLFMAFLGYTLGQIPLLVGMVYYIDKNDIMSQVSMEELEELLTKMDFEALGMDLNLTLFLLLLMFVFMSLFLVLFLKVLHKRHWKTLITPFEKINWSKIFFSFFLWLGFAAILEAVSYFTDPSVYTLTFDLGKFLPMLVIILLLMPIQTTTEELVFRGYLMQGFGIWTKSKIIPLIVTSILFGLMHIMNPEVEKFGMGIMMAYYMSVGCFLGLITIMDGTLELAIGVHAATNMFSAIFVSYSGGALQTNAIFNTEVVDVGMMLPVFFIVATIYFFICWKKYNWEGWSKLMEPIVRPEPQVQIVELGNNPDVLDENV